MNIPNIITLSRILMVPFFVISLLRGSPELSLFIFALAAISDALDGFLARLLKQRTALGAYLDPLADKLLIDAAYISMAMMKMVPDWLAIIVVSRDVIILTGIASLKFMDIPLKISPSRVSKCTTAIQLALICVVLLAPDMGLLDFIYAGTAALTTVSGLHYIYTGMNLLQQSPEPPSFHQ